MSSRNRDGNRADVMRVLLAVGLLALLSLLDDSPAPPGPAAAQGASVSR
ncbi:MAG TPA: hypothetical protein VFU13_12315 [Steroidobacteraceae bacterium]|nr:hypothetical protein [Steroidobacteraceae bacterium]